MSRAITAVPCFVALFTACSAAAAERPRASTSADATLGFGRIGDTSATIGTVVLGLSYDLRPPLALFVRTPISVASLARDDGDDHVAGALGNLEVGARLRLRLSRCHALPISFRMTLPTAGGDAFAPIHHTTSIRRALVNEAASGARGHEEEALFATNRFAIGPRLALDYKRHELRASAFTQLDLLLRAGGYDAPAPLSTSRAAASWLIGGSVLYNLGSVDLGARAWITYAIEPMMRYPVGSDDAPDRARFALEPDVSFNAGPAKFVIGYIAPVPGPFGALRVSTVVRY
jgi:hypothetical protein